MNVEIPHIEYCIDDSTDAAIDIYNAVQDFIKGDYNSVAAGIELIGESVIEVSHALLDCKNITLDVEHLKSLGEVFASPENFWYSFENNLIINGVDIYNDINECIDDFNAQKFYDFGLKLGEAMSLAIMGPVPEPTMSVFDHNTFKVLNGFTASVTNNWIDPNYLYNNVEGLG